MLCFVLINSVFRLFVCLLLWFVVVVLCFVFVCLLCVCFVVVVVAVVVVVVLGGLLPFTCLDLVNAKFSPDREVIEGIPGGREVRG